MKRIKKTVASIVIALMAFSMMPFNASAAEAFPARISGLSAVQTAVKIADQTGWTGTAILSSSTPYGMVDALTSGPLASFLKAPILLQGAETTLDADTKAELIKLNITKVYVTSGTAVISQDVIHELKDMGIAVESLGGVDRFATSANIAQKMVTLGASVSKVAVAYGWLSQDALSIGPLASAQTEPILLTEKNASPASVQTFMTTNPSVSTTDVIGGTGVISDVVINQFPKATRIYGNTAYDTNVAVLKAFDSLLNYDHVFIANGESAIDALSGAPLAAKYKAGIVLANNALNEGTAYVKSKQSPSSIVTALGGKAVISDSVLGGCAYQAPTTAKVVITPIKSLSAVIGDSVIIPVMATNPNKGKMMYSVTSAPTDLTMTNEGVIYWIPKAAGIYNFNAVVNDAVSPPTSTPVKITVTANSTQVSPVIKPVALGLSKVGTAISYQVVAVDANGDALNYSLVNVPPGAAIDSASGLFSWTPVTAGNVSFVVSVSDGSNSTVKTVDIAIVNDYDIVTKWNMSTLAYFNAKGINNQFGSRAVAMMHTAMFDAINSIDNSYHPYNLLVPANATVSADAAATTSAHTILTNLYPADAATFDTLYNVQMAAIPDGTPKTEGMALGQKTANNIITLRSNDNSTNSNIPYPDGTLPGEYRKTGPMNPVLPGWGNVTPWVLTSGSQFRLQGPPTLTSPEYATAYNETKDLGSRNSTTRTAQQSEDALFWIGGVPDQWFGIARELSAKKNLTMTENARLLALLSTSLADASIAGWDTKYNYGFWRPVTAIINGQLDGNASTIGDPTWKPFLTTPAFPEYASGHSTTSNTGATLLANFFGSDSATFTRTSSTAGLPAHEYTAFSQIAQEAGASRVPGGVHFFFSNLEALNAGAQIGNYVFNNTMNPR